MKRKTSDLGRVVMKAQYAVLCSMASLFAELSPTRAAVTEAWVQRLVPFRSSDSSGAQGVAVSSNGDVVVTGHSILSSSSPSISIDCYTAMYAAATGALLWEKRYNGPASMEDPGQAVTFDGAGNVVVTGSSRSSNRDFDFYTVKYSGLDGALLWEQRYNSQQNYDDQTVGIAVNRDGDVFVTGVSGPDSHTAKYATTDGAVIWERRCHGKATAMALDGNGNVVVTGSSFTNGNADFYTAKYAASDGTMLWDRRYNSPTNLGDFARAVATDANGDVVVTGYSHVGYDNSYVYYSAKYAASDGALLWENGYYGPGAISNNRSSAISVDGNGNVVVTGASNNDCHTVKYAASDGAMIWERRYSSPGSGPGWTVAIGVDGRDNVVVTGSSSQNGSYSTFDYYTAKYSADNGTVLWEKRYDGPVSGSDHADTSHSLAIGRDGTIVVTGTSLGILGATTCATVVYREVLPQLLIEMVSGGVRLYFTGPPGSVSLIERTTTLSHLWGVIGSAASSASGLVEFIDTNRPSGSVFYPSRTP